VGAGATLDLSPPPLVARVLPRVGAIGWALAAITALAAVLRFVDLGHQGYWFDEANTAQLVHFSPGAMLGLIPHSESTPPLYYMVAWVWARVFGTGEAGLRSLSAVVGVATVPVMFAAGRQAISARAGLIAAAFAATNPLLIWYGQEARSYALLVLLASATLLAALWLAAEPRPRRACVWALSAVLALATHYYAVLIVVPLAVWLVVRHRRSRPVVAAVGAVAVCGLALVPLALSQQATGNGNWIAGATLGRRLSQIVPQFLAGFPAPGRGVLVPAAGVLAALALALAVWRGDARTRRVTLGFAVLALGGLALNLLIVAAGTDDVLTRNLLALWPPAALAVAVACAGLRVGGAGLTVGAVICAIGVSGAVAVDVDHDLQRPDWRLVAHAVGTRPVGGAPRLILVQHYRDLLPLSLYLPGLRWSHRGATVREFDVVSFTDPATAGFCWWGSACNLDPSAMQAGYRLAGFHVAWRRQLRRFTVLRLEASRPTRVTPREVARALTTTTLGRDELLVQR
jgi:4-amino-4-deoxy-L-arabinose transferase-like glycosyltransferase